MAIKRVHVLQDRDGLVLTVETSLKKLIKKHGPQYNLLSYQHTQRLCKKKKETSSDNFIIFSGKKGNNYKISWWQI